MLAVIICAGVAVQVSISPVQEAIKLEPGLSDRQTSFARAMRGRA